MRSSDPPPPTGKIRPVYSHWTIYPSQYGETLAWMKTNYGAPSNYFYGLAQADYFNNSKASPTASVPDVLAAMRLDSDGGVPYTQQLHALAVQYGLKHVSYSGGPDNGGGSTVNIGNQILANRDPAMDALLQHHIRDNWFANGPDSFTFFVLSSAYSRYGSWGATDDYRNITTPKYNALVNLLGYTDGGIPIAPSALVATGGYQQVILTWAAVPGAANYHPQRSQTSHGPYSVIATISDTSFTDSAVTNGNSYFYVVTAANSAGESTSSNEASATPQAAAPAAPASLTATAGDRQGTLVWTPVAGASSYNVYQGTTPGGEATTAIATAISGNSYVVPNLINGLDNWIAPESQSRNTPGIGNQYEITGQLEHLPTALANVKTVGSNPWLIVNMALSELEWGELIDYLSAPAGVGYAARRPASHPGPYTADFGTIYLEVGNEEWGTQNVPVDFAYGQWAHFVVSKAIANNTYFDATRIKIIVNGFILNPAFGAAAIAAAPEASIVDYALYSGGDTTFTGDAYSQSDLLQLPATNESLIDKVVAQQQLDAAKGRAYGLAAYEEGPGQDTPVHNGDTTLAAAVGAIDVNLYASLRGFGVQNFFLFN